MSRNGYWIVISLVAIGTCAASDQPRPRFVAPTNEREREQRIKQLDAAYAPYLRSHGER